MEITDRTIVVTGATSGIGEATARRLAAEGGRVALLARTESDLESVAATIRDRGGEAQIFPTDLAERDEIAATAERIRSEMGDPEVLVNSAGVGSWTELWETDPGEAEWIMDVTVFGAYNLAREFLPAMLERDRGHVVTIESPTGHAPIAGATAYQTARYALRGFCESLWMDLYSTDVGVTSVVPGKVDTEYFERNDNVEERFPGIARHFRTLDPEDVAGAVYRGLREEKRRVVLPPELKWMLRARRVAPDTLDAQTARGGWQPGDQN